MKRCERNPIITTWSTVGADVWQKVLCMLHFEEVALIRRVNLQFHDWTMAERLWKAYFRGCPNKSFLMWHTPDIREMSKAMLATTRQTMSLEEPSVRALIQEEAKLPSHTCLNWDIVDAKSSGVLNYTGLALSCECCRRQSPDVGLDWVRGRIGRKPISVERQQEYRQSATIRAFFGHRFSKLLWYWRPEKGSMPWPRLFQA